MLPKIINGPDRSFITEEWFLSWKKYQVSTNEKHNLKAYALDFIYNFFLQFSCITVIKHRVLQNLDQIYGETYVKMSYMYLNTFTDNDIDTKIWER